ncbi:Cof-type HAD-IIB family hydrolase [Intestinibacillus massiliensis]|nr:Cof-type HAD-IIB family hydrolase [Intestinibacillus massiliensis]
MNYDLIALDLDGTALSSNNEVQNSTIEAVRWARGRGVRVVVSTGRICGEAAEFSCKMGADDFIVASGGATLGTAADRRCYTRLSMPWEPSVRAAAILERVGLTTMAYLDGEIFVTPYSDFAFTQYKTNEGFLNSKVVVDSVAEAVATRHLPVDKLFCRSKNTMLLQNARGLLEGIEGIRVMSSAEDNLEVVAPYADKGTALGMLCMQLGTSLERAIAIGDSENDLEMLAAVGMPVAMGNADPRVKGIARYITADNNHGGVAQAIYHLLGKD